ncbi:hypothetical protein ABTX62_05865 [Streptomyces sp. NPDC096046]|uniref:hypothetical protein n=1 Tax=Streptomyces sp. NPDC096046 TaxID=3155542 RepID=UPI003316F38E
MTKITVTAAVLGLTALGLAVPAAAQATETTVAGPGCADKWGPRDGRLYAWDEPDCQGPLLPVPYSGTWSPAADNRASSVMNRAYTGGLDHAALYDKPDRSGGHICLAPGELYADDLTDDRFTDGTPVNNAISAHGWVNRSTCGAFLT